MPDAEPALPAEFVTRLMAGQGALHACIVALTGGLEHANDLLQETNLKLCRKAAEYDPAQPFLPWARTFARFEVMAWRTKLARSRVFFDDELVARIAAVFESVDGDEERNEERELAALESCVERLPERQRAWVEARYRHREPLQAIAARAGMEENAMAALFYRLRKALANCVELSVGREARP